jgi:hypothetical protein
VNSSVELAGQPEGMKLRWTLAGAAAALALAAPAHAADTVLATTARATPLAADAGNVLYSAWDGSQYRLTLLHGGTLPVAGASQPFTADLGPGPGGHEVAVYPRCTHGATGCDLYLYDLVTRQERKLAEADSPSDDELAGALWRDRLVFARAYRNSRGEEHGVLYTRTLGVSGASKRVSGRLAFAVDVRGTRVSFEHALAWSTEPDLGSTSGSRVQQLAVVPGSGAAVDYLHAENPTAYGSSVYWALASDGDHTFTEIHRYNRTLGRDERDPLRVPQGSSGFAYDAGTAYYAVPSDPNLASCVPDRDCPTTIHARTGMAFEKAPPIKLR